MSYQSKIYVLKVYGQGSIGRCLGPIPDIEPEHFTDPPTISSCLKGTWTVPTHL